MKPFTGIMSLTITCSFVKNWKKVKAKNNFFGVVNWMNRAFHKKALEDYLLYMNELVHDVYAFLAEQCDIKGADVLLGSLCFEVNAE